MNAGGMSAWGIVNRFRLISLAALSFVLATTATGASAADPLDSSPVDAPATPPAAPTPAADAAVTPAPAPATVPAPAPPTAPADREVTFSSDQLDYDSDADIVTATGNVYMMREGGDRLRADEVVWDRKSGRVRASGNVVVENANGDKAYSDSAELTDTLKDGMAENMLLVLKDGGRLVADSGKRVNGVSTLNHAAYTPCAVVDARTGCPKKPVWKITAVRVVHDPATHRISYRDARLSMFGLPILYLPALSHPDGSQGGGSGLLVPQFRYTRTNGFELSAPYYWLIAPNRDLTVTPHLFTGVLPGLEAKYRALTSTGAFQVGGFVTYGSSLPLTTAPTPAEIADRNVRGYFDANGRFQLGPDWTISGSIRLTTDKTFLHRYDISLDDRLRSTVNAERITGDSYLSIAGWFVQSLRVGDTAGLQPIALPAVDFRYRVNDPLLGGVIQLQANSLSIIRTEGQDTQRAFAGARWDLRRYTPLGQEITFTAYSRFDVYHTSDVESTSVAIYRGDPGWQGRAIGALAVDMRWPFVGTFFNGTQVITPRVQIVATPPTRNLEIPNEDARAVDLEDSNLFALNRFPGYDRWEDGSRVTYGVEWSFDLPRLSFRTIIGQSYRLNNRASIFPDGTGLSDRMSDIVGRTTVKYGSFIDITDRYRIDKDSFALRRHEVDLTLGSHKTYLQVGYLRLNRDIDTAIEDLRDHEEVRFGARAAFARYWSVFGSMVIDLTDKSEDPLSTSNGYQPVRHRLGILYENECLELGVTWRRDYETTGDVKKGNSFLLQLALKNLGS